MAKRSKKKNPDTLNSQQRENLRFNQALDLEKSKLDKKLNVTVAVVIALSIIALLLLPAFDISFSGSLSDFTQGGDLVDVEDQAMEIGVAMSFFDFMFAMTKGYSNSFEYIAKVKAGSDFEGEFIYAAMQTKVTPEEIKMFDNAYIVAFVLSIALLIVSIAFVVITAIMRSKKRDGILLLTSTIVFSVLAIFQWIFFVAMGIASAGRGQLQPHVASYLLFASSITWCVVYGLYRKKVKKLNAQRKPVENIQSSKDIKEES